jgi:glutaredoxin
MFDWLGQRLSLPIQRTPEAQRSLDELARDMVLYTLPWCGYCARVRRAIRRLNVPIEQRNTAKNPEWERELRQGGGKMQAPCLRINHRDKVEWHYESDAIIRVLYQHFTTPEDEG